jgi:hypothetical protein
MARKTDPKVQAELDAMLAELQEARKQGKPVPIAQVPDNRKGTIAKLGQSEEVIESRVAFRAIGWIVRHDGGISYVPDRPIAETPVYLRDRAKQRLNELPLWPVYAPTANRLSEIRHHLELAPRRTTHTPDDDDFIVSEVIKHLDFGVRAEGAGSGSSSGCGAGSGSASACARMSWAKSRS